MRSGLEQPQVKAASLQTLVLLFITKFPSFPRQIQWCIFLSHHDKPKKKKPTIWMMMARLPRGLYIPAKRVDASSVGGSFWGMSSVTEPLCKLNMKPGHFNRLHSEFSTNVTQSLTWASVRMLALYLEHLSAVYRRDRRSCDGRGAHFDRSQFRDSRASKHQRLLLLCVFVNK